MHRQQSDAFLLLIRDTYCKEQNKGDYSERRKQRRFKGRILDTWNSNCINHNSVHK